MSEHIDVEIPGEEGAALTRWLYRPAVEGRTLDHRRPRLRSAGTHGRRLTRPWRSDGVPRSGRRGVLPRGQREDHLDHEITLRSTRAARTSEDTEFDTAAGAATDRFVAHLQK